jgi:uncharacterized protein
MMTELEANGPIDGPVNAPRPGVDDMTTQQALPAAPVVSEAPLPEAPSSDSRNVAMLAHLSSLVAFAGVPSLIGPLVLWLLHRDRDSFAADAAREALNFNLSLLLYAALATVGVIATIGLGLIVVVPAAILAAVAWLVLTVVAAAHAGGGETYRYPLTLRLVQ